MLLTSYARHMGADQEAPPSYGVAVLALDNGQRRDSTPPQWSAAEPQRGRTLEAGGSPLCLNLYKMGGMGCHDMTITASSTDVL